MAKTIREELRKRRREYALIHAQGLREVLKETPALAPKSNDPEAIAKALERMIDDPETFKNKAREYALEARNRFDVAHAVAKLKDLYDRESSA